MSRSYEFPSPECDFDADLLQRFGEGRVERSERRQVMKHLLSGCDSCRGAVRGRFQLLDSARADENSLSVSRVLEKVASFESQLNLERAAADDLWADFERHPPQRQWTLLKNSARFDSWSFCEKLHQAGWYASYDNPHRALELNQMALLIAERIPGDSYGRNSGADLLAKSWGRLANSLRATSDLAGAEAALTKAKLHLDEGSGEPLGEAEFYYMKSSLRRAQRRLDEALVAVRRSSRIYRMIQDRHLEGLALLSEAAVHDVSGDAPRACALARQAVAQIDAARDFRLALAARHNVVWYLMSAGRGDEALRELEFMRPLYFETGDRMNILRLKWMEGRIYRLQGEALAAESSLREAHAGFVDAKIPYEAATVALDLAVFLAEKGRIHELKHLAADLVAVFRRLGVAREACAALMIFESVAQAEAVTVSLITRLSDYLQRVRAHPELRFEHDH